MAWIPCSEGHGDFNGDGVIDEKDFALFRECNWKLTSEHPECIPMDFTGPREMGGPHVPDGRVTALDFSAFNQLYGGFDPICDIQLEPTPTGPTSTGWNPLLLLGMAVLGLLLLRKRK